MRKRIHLYTHPPCASTIPPPVCARWTSQGCKLPGGDTAILKLYSEHFSSSAAGPWASHPVLQGGSASLPANIGASTSALSALSDGTALGPITLTSKTMLPVMISYRVSCTWLSLAGNGFQIMLVIFAHWMIKLNCICSSAVNTLFIPKGSAQQSSLLNSSHGTTLDTHTADAFCVLNSPVFRPQLNTCFLSVSLLRAETTSYLFWGTLQQFHLVRTHNNPQGEVVTRV